jgi:hypothetical protein
MMHCLVKITALLCPAGKTISPFSSKGSEPSTIVILRELQHILDQVLRGKYEHRSQACFNSKVGVGQTEVSNMKSRLTR